MTARQSDLGSIARLLALAQAEASANVMRSGQPWASEDAAGCENPRGQRGGLARGVNPQGSHSAPLMQIRPWPSRGLLK
eukprot:CAMPEP_0177263436 /NCGR_PEP_ID=MMETSP0367-20130122/60983_1 /TAXON_ID=447022 ORGANISM="Scrippsiella hangoei-like, Strain SHHI-4" /NCGR_SAMPLE_ID=MMETSP0367 /ASSEMBLY_ACC=CAM_ASM_000362 /LENGTH=78 /DNA_ID=CAMNT_0018718405 /DNA_START=9 /DNA_END=243 /DNA_ORIENTATION=+